MATLRCSRQSYYVLEAAALCLRSARGGGGVWFDAVVLVDHDEGRPGGERHAHRRAAAVTLDVDKQLRAACCEGRLKLAQRLEAEGGGAVGGPPGKACAAARREAVFDDGHAPQRQLECSRHSQCHLERGVALAAMGGAQDVEYVRAGGAWRRERACDHAWRTQTLAE